MKRFFKHLLAKAGYSVACVRHVPGPLLDPANLRTFQFDDAVCRRMHEVGRELVFLQIGVYDGITHDPLRRHILESDWKGVMVEPQSKCVTELRELYADRPGIQILHAAIDEHPGERTLYTVDAPEAPDWTGGLASFDRETVAKHEQWCPGLSSMIREEMVPCVSFEHALQMIPGNRLDILQIDTEGADGLILSLFPFETIHPAIVHFEIKHLNRSEQESAFTLLTSHGYKLSPSGGEDMLAVREA